MIVKPKTSARPIVKKVEEPKIQADKNLPKYKVVYKEEVKTESEEVVKEQENEDLLFDLLQDLGLNEEE